MATRSSGRSQDRSNARGASGRGSTGGNAKSGSGTTGTSGTGGSSRSGGSSAASAASGTRGQTANAPSGANATRQATSSQNETRQTTSGAPSNSASRVGGGSGTISNAGASASASAPPARGDQEREVRTAREQGNMRPAAAGQQRANPARQSADFLSSMPGSGVGSTPFAMMRRMMDDMDRLFSDYGFTHPGILASSLLSPEIWGTPRGLGRGAAAGSSVSPAQSGQQNLQRGGQRGLQQPGARGLWAPHVEVFERGNNIVVRADLPGLAREDVDVEVDDDALIIRGERHSDIEDEQEGYYRSERSYGSFYRAIPLPENIDHNACTASFKDGVLEVTLPKPAPQQSRAKRIDVR